MVSTSKTLPEVQDKLYINGEWADGSLEETSSVINPATGETLIELTQGSKEDTEKAIQAAKETFPQWANMELKKRVELLHQIADKIEENTERLALIMSLEQGKPLAEAAGEIQTNIENLHWNAEESRRVYGETIPAPNGHKFEVKKQPVGVVGAITPWNFPSNMIIRKIAPAIAAGCTIVLKPASQTPLSAIALFEIFDEAGLPKGVANLVLGPSSDIGEALTESDDVKKLTFTGSTAVGKSLYQQSADTLKKISLELGGHAPFIVFDDASIKETVDTLVAMKFRNAGQACTAPNRIFVHEAIKKEFTEILIEAVQDVTVGYGTDEETDMGPLINEDAIKTIDAQLSDAKEKGAKVLIGGKRLTEDDFNKGNFYAPTVIDQVTNEMDIFYEETFGPVIPLLSFTDEEAVIESANDSVYGLASYLFTKDLKRAEKVSSALEYGLVGLNNTGVSQSETPFGGVKHSGLGRENGKEGIEGFMEIKFVHTTYFEK